MQRLTIIFSILVFSSLACSLGGLIEGTPTPTSNLLPAPSVATQVSGADGGNEIPSPTSSQEPKPPDRSKASPCGDGVCNGPENTVNCPADCGPGAESAVPAKQASTEEYRVANPASGVELYVHVTTPDIPNAVLSPAVVLVPGGSGDSAKFRAPQGEANVLAQAGYLVVVFDADGRGQSAGQEDYNGFIHQDGLAAVIAFAADLPQVDSDRIALVSYSYGITMASGALARHPDLPVLFLLDWEGPANRDDTGGCDGAGLGHLNDVASCNDEAFWSEREASTFIGQVRAPYQRLQSEKDHVQPDHAHAILMVNNAVAGGVPWVRLNRLNPNQTYDQNNMPSMLAEAESRSLEQLTLEYLPELFDLHHKP